MCVVSAPAFGNVLWPRELRQTPGLVSLPKSLHQLAGLVVKDLCHSFSLKGDLQLLLLNGLEPLQDWAGNEYKCKSQTNSKTE